MLDAVDFLALPSTQSQQAVIQRRAVVCTDVEVFKVFLYGFHNLPRAGTAVHTGTFDADAVLFQIREDALQRVLQAETHVSIAIVVLYAHDEVTYDCHAGTVARELLVSHLCIVLLRLYELVVEVKVVRRSFHELAGVHEHLHQQTVQFSSCIEVVVDT